MAMSIPEMVAALEALRTHVCAYGGATPCDCKYGLEPTGPVQRSNMRTNAPFWQTGSEKTGCPELRETINFLITMHADKIVVPEDAPAPVNAGPLDKFLIAHEAK